MNHNKTPALLLATALALAGTVAGQTGGGTVTNADPLVTLFSGDVATSPDNLPVTETWTWTVEDANGATDIIELTVAARDATGTAWSATAKAPFTNGTGWAFTSTTGTTLEGTYEHAWTSTQRQGGPYNITLTHVEDSTGAADDDGDPYDTTVFSDTSNVIVSTQLYNDSCVPVPPPLNGWSAAPGAVNVTRERWLKVSNTGTGTGHFAFSWQESAFQNGTAEVAIDGNLRWRTVTTNALGCPETGSETLSTLDADGSVVFSIEPLDVLWVNYRLDAIPSPLPSGAYIASFTAQGVN